MAGRCSLLVSLLVFAFFSLAVYSKRSCPNPEHCAECMFYKFTDEAFQIGNTSIILESLPMLDNLPPEDKKGILTNVLLKACSYNSVSFLEQMLARIEIKIGQLRAVMTRIVIARSVVLKYLSLCLIKSSSQMMSLMSSY